MAFAFQGGRLINLDVATANLVCLTALSKTCQAYLESVEATKDRSYGDYYTHFHPFVLSLAGGLTERSWNVLKLLGGIASDVARPRLKWERYMWAVHMLRHINAGMAKVVAWEARTSSGSLPRAPGP